MPKRPLISVDLVPPRGVASHWILRLPAAVAGKLCQSSHLIHGSDGGLDETELAPVIHEIRAFAQQAVEPLVLLSGHPSRQSDMLDAVRAAGLLASVRPVLCVSAQHRPLWPAPDQVLHGLIADNPPTAAERAWWRQALRANIGGRVREVPPAQPPPDATESASDRAPDTTHVSMIALEGDAWMGLGIHAFKIWAHGCYRCCQACGAISLDRFLPHLGRFVPRDHCLYCGADRLVSSGGRPDARLTITLAGEDEPLTDPDILGRWLALGGQLQVRREASRTDGTCRDESADIVLVLNDPAYPDARLAVAMASGATPVTNNDPDRAGCTSLAACHGWDWHGQVTAYPALPALVRALEAAGQASGTSRGTLPAAPVASDTAAAWRDAIEALMAMPRPGAIRLRRRFMRRGAR